MVDEQTARKLAKERRPKDEIYGAYGPTLVGTMSVWEIWVLERSEDEDEDGGEYATRFVTEVNGKPEYFYSFGELSILLNDRLRLIDDRRWELMARLVTLVVAAISFLSTVFTLLYMFAKGNVQLPEIALLTLLGLISSGAALFFGNWIPIGGGSAPQNPSGK